MLPSFFFSAGGRERKLYAEVLRVFLFDPGRAGLEIVDFAGLNGPLLQQNPLEKVGGQAPHLFQWVLLLDGGV